MLLVVSSLLAIFAGFSAAVSTCDITTACSRFALSITDPVKCTCDCMPGYAPPRCDRCASGYAGYSRGQCNLCRSIDCSGHGDGIMDAATDQCVCACRNNWVGNTCSDCPEHYDPIDCLSCAALSVPVAGSPGTCQKCDQAALCPAPLGTRVYVTNKQRTNEQICACDCAPNVRSLPDVHGGKMCNVCAAGFYFVKGAAVQPVPSLISPSDCKPCPCGGRGRAIGGDGIFEENCVCECDGFWTPSSGAEVCSTCPACPKDPAAKCTKCGTDACPCCYDSTCNRCARDRVSPPGCMSTCDDLCGVEKGRAVAKQNFANAAQDACLCTCTTGYAGSTCSECAAGYKSVDEGGKKLCKACTDELVASDNGGESCKFHVGFQVDEAGKCHCKCQTGYSGRFCTQCAEDYFNFPTCKPFTCSISENCNGHAVSVDKVQATRTCDCQCAHQWMGAQCQDCPAEFDPITCAACAKGRVDYPRCVPCDATPNAKQVSVSADGRSCVVECMRGFTCRNPPCAKCDICDTVRGFYQTNSAPLTCEQCVSQVHCSGHAARVVPAPDASGCVCSCAEGYAGDQCDKCALTSQQYPYCVGCSIQASCKGHATSVKMVAAVSGAASCECQCSGHWEGPQCDICPPEYDPTRACDDCAEGFVKDVNGRCTSCQEKCGNHNYFSSNLARSECICGCKCSATQCYAGPRCDRCENGYVNYPTCAPCSPTVAQCVVANTLETYTPIGTGDCLCRCAKRFRGAKCDKCAVGYHDYPQCRSCDIEDCGGPLNAERAYTVEENGVMICKCACVGGWEGPNCQTCPAIYDEKKACSACAVGFFGFPNCQRCDESFCVSPKQGVAVVDTVQSRCFCTCQEGYAGRDCSTCDKGFVRRSGLVGAPDLQCERCTVEKDCSVNTITVEPSTDQRRCVCQCATGWAGEKCDECAAGYRTDATVTPPTCRRCTQADCSYHASFVVTLANACRCVCSNPWTGSKCEICPSTRAGALCRACERGYDNFPQCNTCAFGFQQMGDLCLECDLSMCNGRASSVYSTPDRQSCQCMCLPGYEGSKCEKCVVGYKRVGTTCVKCNVVSDCSGHALSVTTDPTIDQCVCQCAGGWRGPQCQTCGPDYFGPKCETCTTAHCYNRATGSAIVKDACVCSGMCYEGYEGDKCERCAEGYVGWPNCVKCTVATHCNNNAVSVATNFARTLCECTCKAGFREETRCKDCDDGTMPAFGVCGQCPEGTVGTPGTCRACTTEADCSGHATRVVTLDGRCYCTCQEGFTGPSCNQCDVGSGYVEYPQCRQCNAARDCMGRGVVTAPQPDGQGCQCACRSPWFGSGCTQCTSTQCPPCGFGAVGTPPDCRPCDGQVDCNGNQLSVAVLPSGLGCSCTCQPRFSGPRCGQCAAGHFGYPTCGRCTSTDFCSGVGTAQLLSADACTCVCKPQHTGVRCELCSQGYVGWPECRPLSANGGVSTAPSSTSDADGSGGSSRELAITTCLGDNAQVDSSIRTAMLNTIGVPGAQLEYTRAAEAAVDVGNGCTVRAFRITSLPATAVSGVEVALMDAVASNQALRLQLRVVGQVRVLSRAEVPAQNDSGNTVVEPTLVQPSGGGGMAGAETYLFGTTWLTPGLSVGILVGGLVVIATFGMLIAFVVFFLMRPFAVQPPPMAG